MYVCLCLCVCVHVHVRYMHHTPQVQDFKELEFVDYHSSATIALSPTEVKALSFGKWSGTIIMDIGRW